MQRARSDSSAAVRQTAVRALATTAPTPTEVLVALTRASLDPVPGVRAVAYRGMGALLKGQLGSQARALLLQAAHDSVESVRDAASVTLSPPAPRPANY
ncbi:MAG: HEAT repeat domain-containing protein [bacterium]